MNKKEKIVLCLVLIYIVIVSVILICKINEEPEYDQELYDEIYSQYEMQKNDTQENTTSTNTNIAKKQNPTYMTIKAQGREFKVIGKIIINKINIEYPIISETTDENLKLAPTKLCGPLINTSGNLCIVGHNYLNNKLFSNLSELQKNDEVILVDNNNNQVKYQVFDKYVVKEDNLECTSQNTSGSIEVTLITCTNKKNERLIVKCKKI